MTAHAEAVSEKPEPSTVPERRKEKEEKPPSQADLLVQIAQTKGSLCHDAYEEAYLTVPRGTGHETMKLRSRRTRAWLDREYFGTFGRVASAQAKIDAIGLLEGIALHESDGGGVCLRTGEHEGRVYVDLGDETHEAIEITPAGWRVVRGAPVRFLRPKGMQALPRPERGGSVEELRAFVNVASETHFRLLVAWIVASQRPRGPYPILCLQGEHGSSKSTTTRLVRRLVDPNSSPVRAAPRELRDLAIAGNAAHVLAFDNLSGVPAWLSDALCRVATGGGFATRALHTDDEEVIFDFIRPVVVNGIDDVATRPDLADRCLVITLPAIRAAKRRRERDILASFASAAPRIYGAILSAVAGALGRESEVDLVELPRMADFAVFATAAEEALGWSNGDFMRAYQANRNDATSIAFDADLVAQAVVRFMASRSEWTGPARDLLEQLAPSVSERDRESRAWPGAAHVLSARLRRAAPVLRELGVDVDADVSEGRGRDKRRVLALRGIAKPSVPSVPMSDIAQESGASQPARGRSVADEEFSRSQANSVSGATGVAGDAGSGGIDAPFADWVDDERLARGEGA
jgi:hypothetical protein